MIPNELIDQVLDKTNIVEVISPYVQLKRAGQNFKACCPFHEEKTASFVVSPGKQIFHCFGCGQGGNAISFLMKHERMEFIEALKLLSDKAGVVLPRSGLKSKSGSSFADMLYSANNIAASYYSENLAKDSGRAAHRYFVERGIVENTAKLFRLGYAPDGWQGIVNHCRTSGVNEETQEKAGLILQHPKTRNWYDRFRNRVIFPIFDVRNRVLGFGARSLDNSLPKYINSPETHIYRKGTNLYGLNFSKDYVRKLDYAIIVEGYFDLIIPYQNEIRNVVATLGTALTPEQIGLLRRFTRNAIIVYDSDKAGEAATLRGLDLLLGEDMNVRIAILPKGLDPDSFVRREGKSGFIKILKDSKDIFDYKLDKLTERFRKEDPRAKARIVEEMLPTMHRIKNAVLRSAYLKKMSERLSLDEESIRTELKKSGSGTNGTYTSAREAAHIKKPSRNLAEMSLLALAMEDVACVEAIEQELGYTSFKDVSIACILKKISELHKDGKTITLSHLMSCFGGDGKELIISEAANLSPNIGDRKKVLNDCFRHIRKNNLKSALDNIERRIREAERGSDATLVNSLIGEYDQLIKGISNES